MTDSIPCLGLRTKLKVTSRKAGAILKLEHEYVIFSRALHNHTILGPSTTIVTMKVAVLRALHPQGPLKPWIQGGGRNHQAQAAPNFRAFGI